jgi:hypothetical protein
VPLQSEASFFQSRATLLLFFQSAKEASIAADKAGGNL